MHRRSFSKFEKPFWKRNRNSTFPKISRNTLPTYGTLQTNLSDIMWRNHSFKSRSLSVKQTNESQPRDQEQGKRPMQGLKRLFASPFAALELGGNLRICHRCCKTALNTGTEGAVPIDMHGLSIQQQKSLNRITDVAEQFTELLIASPGRIIRVLESLNISSALVFMRSSSRGALDTS